MIRWTGTDVLVGVLIALVILMGFGILSALLNRIIHS